MTKNKYHYNLDTCNYEPVLVSNQKRLFRILGYTLLATIVAAGCLFFYYQNYPTPKVNMLRAQRQMLDMQWAMLNTQIGIVADHLEKIQVHDDDLREILELDMLPTEIRNAGIGGGLSIEELRKQNLRFEDRIITLTQKLTKLKARLTIEVLSMDTIAKYAEERDRFWSHIPAIQPIDNKDLRRFSPIYGLRMNPVLHKMMPHRGLDFMGNRGIPVYATGDGVVTLARMTHGGFGNQIIINHGYGYRTRYAHLYSANPFNVEAGESVKRGQIIGYMGNTGRSAGIHLHYEVFKDGVHVNPIGFFQRNLDEASYTRLLKLAMENTAPLD